MIKESLYLFKEFVKNPINTMPEGNTSSYKKYTCAVIIYPLFGFCISSLLWLIVTKMRDAIFFTLIEIDSNEYRGIVFNLFVTVLLAPLFEGGIFRYPIKFIPKKGYYNLTVCFITILFWVVNFVNYETNFSGKLLFFVIVSPQLFIGLLLAFVRIKFGFKYSILTHSIYNFICFFF
jgi:hypothetical protein